MINIEKLQVVPDLAYPEHPIKILDRKDRVTRRHTRRFYKVQWSNHSENEATWEWEDFLNSQHLDFLNMHQGTSHLTLF